MLNKNKSGRLSLVIALSIIYPSVIFAQSFVPTVFPSEPSAWKTEQWSIDKSQAWEKKQGGWGLLPASVVNEGTQKYLMYGWFDHGVAKTSLGSNSWNKLQTTLPAITWAGTSRHAETGFKDPNFGKLGNGAVAKFEGKNIVLAMHDDHKGSTGRYPVIASSPDLKQWSIKKISTIDYYTSSLVFNEVNKQWYGFFWNKKRHMDVVYGDSPYQMKTKKSNILVPSEPWEKAGNEAPAAFFGKVLRDKQGWLMIYHGQFFTGIGLARSTDLINWTKVGRFIDESKRPFHLLDVTPITLPSEGKVKWEVYFSNKGSKKAYRSYAYSDISATTLIKPFDNRKKFGWAYLCPSNCKEYKANGRKY